MLYELAHFIQNKLRPVWSLVEVANSLLFQLRYASLLKRIPELISSYPGVVRVTKDDVSSLAGFFASQPKEAFDYFTPHSFDAAELAKLVGNHSRLMFAVKDEDGITGYFFLRCFFIGKCYLGKMVDSGHQGQGIGQMICCCAIDIASALKMKMYESISKENIASLYATQKVLETRVVKELENGVLYIEDIRRKPICG